MTGRHVARHTGRGLTARPVPYYNPTMNENINRTASRRRIVLGAVSAALVLVLAAMALSRILAEVRLEQVLAGMDAVGWRRIAIACLLTTACYLALSGYDMIALRAVGRPLPWARVVQGSTAAYALSHNLGFAPLTASYARLRVYSRDGVGVADVARIVVLTGTAFWLGVVLVFGICLLVMPEATSLGGWLGTRQMRMAAGLLIVDLLVVYLVIISRGVRIMGRGRWSVPLPTMPDALMQTVISLLEMTLASAVLWMLIPSAGAAMAPAVLVAYVSAFVMVLITHVPGGAGVLEAIVVVMLPDVPKAEAVSALILFRIIFHLVPLAVAAAILALNRRPKVHASSED